MTDDVFELQELYNLGLWWLENTKYEFVRDDLNKSLPELKKRIDDLLKEKH